MKVLSKRVIAKLNEKEIAWRERFINKRPAPIKPIIPGTFVYLVHGETVRSLYDSDYVEAGNGYRYDWIPKNEFWIDDSMPESEMYYSLLHESKESQYMAKGDSYDTAHDKAKKIEDSVRHQALPPGELEPPTYFVPSQRSQ